MTPAAVIVSAALVAATVAVMRAVAWMVTP